VKNFVPDKANKVRIWKGIGLRGSVPNPPSGTQSVPPQKSCKQGGRETFEGQISPDSENFSEYTPRVGRFLANGHNLSLLSLYSSDAVTVPSRGRWMGYGCGTGDSTRLVGLPDRGKTSENLRSEARPYLGSRGGDFSGSCTVTSRNRLPQIHASSVASGSRFGDETAPRAGPGP
jgi:hypothetical protein